MFKTSKTKGVFVGPAFFIKTGINNATNSVYADVVMRIWGWGVVLLVGFKGFILTLY